MPNPHVFTGDPKIPTPSVTIHVLFMPNNNFNHFRQYSLSHIYIDKVELQVERKLNAVG